MHVFGWSTGKVNRTVVPAIGGRIKLRAGTRTSTTVRGTIRSLVDLPIYFSDGQGDRTEHASIVTGQASFFLISRSVHLEDHVQTILVNPHKNLQGVVLTTLAVSFFLPVFIWSKLKCNGFVELGNILLGSVIF